MAKQKTSPASDDYIQCSLTAIEAFSGLPIEFRPDNNNIADMKRIVDELVKQDAGSRQLSVGRTS